MERLTLDNHVLTYFLVLLALATNLVSQPITLITKSMAALTLQITLHQLALYAQDQLGTREDVHTSHLDEYLPSPMHGQCCSPNTLVKHVLDIVHPLNIGQNLPWGGELLI